MKTDTRGHSRPDWVDNSLYPFEDNWMIIEGHQIHYVDEGPRNAPVLLFVHPGAGWSFTYRYQIQQLKKDFRCVAPDLPGYGFSTAREGYHYTLLEQADVLERFVDALNLQRIVVWANDGGGPTAILAMANDIDRVLGLVIGGTFGWSIKPYRMVVWPLRIFTGKVFRFLNRYTNGLAWSMGTKMALGTRALTKTERRHYTRPFKQRGSRNRTLRLYASFLDADIQKALDRAISEFHDKPVLIEFGEKDAMTGQHWPERWAKELPNSSTHILRGVKHFTFEAAPEATVENFQSWWSEITDRSNKTESHSGVPLIRPV